MELSSKFGDPLLTFECAFSSLALRNRGTSSWPPRTLVHVRRVDGCG
jgi:hypothetical protein